MSHRQSKGKKTSAPGMRDENNLLFPCEAGDVLFVTSAVPWKSRSWASTGWCLKGHSRLPWFFSVLWPAVGTVQEEELPDEVKKSQHHFRGVCCELWSPALCWLTLH